MKKYVSPVFAYLGWVVAFLVGIWFIWRSLSLVSFGFARRYLNATVAQWQIGKEGIFFEEVWVIVSGIGLLVAMLFAEAYIKKGIAKGDLFSRIGRVIGLELIVVFGVDVLTLWVGGMVASWSYWAIMATELVVGFVLVQYARKAWPFRRLKKV